MKRSLHLWMLGLICLAALLLRCEGVRWPAYHPDEYPIARWIDWTREHAYVGERFYANGFFVLARPARAATEGVWAAADWASQHMGAPSRELGLPTWILWARGFNVGLGVLTCLLVFGMARRITGSSGSGLLAAALLAVSQYPVEHSHYGETDIAMLATLIAAMWLLAAARDRGGPWRLAGAALACGYAAGTKLTLMALLPSLAAVVLLAPRSAGGRAWVQLPLRLAGALLAGLAGFYLAHPGVAHWTWFVEAVRVAGEKVYQETSLNMGPLAGDAHVRHLAHLKQLAEYAGSVGWGVLVLAAAGVPLALGSRFRRFWPVVLLFPAVFLFYWVFKAPWVRSQESMAFLPGLLVLASLPLLALWSRPRVGIRLAAVVLGAWAAGSAGWRGAQVASVFGWDDTRDLAREWLERHLPYESVLAAERYSGQACPETRSAPLDIAKIERTGLAALRQANGAFFLRTSTYAGRGIEHPLTGLRYPAPERVFQEFQDGSELLGTWAPMPPHGQATFCSPNIELYGLRRFEQSRPLDVLLPQPVWASDRERETVFPDLADLGAATALRIDRRPRCLALAGPGEPTRPVFLVAWTRERAADVRGSGFGRRFRAHLEPYDVTVVRLDRPWWRPRLRHFEAVTVSTEPEKNTLLVPCYVRLATSPAEVVQALAVVGQEERAQEFLSEAEMRRSLPPVTQYMLAVNGGRWAQADPLRAAARREFEALDAARAEPPDALRIRGRSAHYIDAFARVHLAPPRQVKSEVLARKKDDDGRPVEPPVYEMEIEVPVALGMGRFDVGVDLRLGDSVPGTNVPVTMELIEELRDTGRSMELPSLSADRYERVSFELAARQDHGFRLRIRSPAPLTLYSRDLAVRWASRDAVESVRDRLGAALVADALHAGDREAASVFLRRISEERWNELELRELAFSLDPTGAESAARLLAVAPDHYGALRVLAVARGDAAMVERVTGLRETLAHPVIFGRFVRLVSVEERADGGFRCVFEALRNDTPPLAAVLWDPAFGSRKWKSLAVAPLSQRPLARGERVAVTITLPPGKSGRLADLAMGVRSNVRWQPGVLKPEGDEERGVRLGTLLGR